MTSHEITMDHEITTSREITMGGEITMWREITMATEIMMDGEIMTRRSQQTAAMGHGMDARRGGRFRAETAHPTKVRAVVAGTPRMDVHPVTRYRGETARNTAMMEGEAGGEIIEPR
jgi:hypothetical protein